MKPLPFPRNPPSLQAGVPAGSPEREKISYDKVNLERRFDYRSEAPMKRLMIAPLVAVLFGLVFPAFAGEKVEICHRSQTITIDEKALVAHLRHGDHLGSCCDPPDDCVTDTVAEKVVVANFNSNNVTLIDAESNSPIAIVPVQHTPLRAV